MSAHIHKLPTIEDLAALSHRAMVSFAIRCAQRAEPLYAQENPDVERARFIRACIESAIQYFITGNYCGMQNTLSFDSTFADYGVQAAEFAALAAEAAFQQETDSDYDTEMAEDEESTPAHRTESTAIFSLFAAYHTHLPLEEAQRIERVTLNSTLTDFRQLMQLTDLQDVSNLGELWSNGCPDSVQKRLEIHNRLLQSESL